MNTTLRLALGFLAVTAPAWLMLRAGEPADAPTTGKVLVLLNEKTVEGEIERVGNQYRIRRATGELWLHGEHVLQLCETREAAYKYLRSRANLLDPDEHLRLAKWCHQQGLRQQALEEVQAAVNLRPEDADSQRLLRGLQRSEMRNLESQTAKPEEQEARSNIQPPPVNTETLSLFVTKVQPTLMNACASCHATGRGGSFKLTRAYDGAANRKSTQQNLTAVLLQINYEKPASSPLLSNAVNVHGGLVHPPLKNRETAAFQVLDDWMRRTIEGNPQLVEQALIASANAAKTTTAPSEQTGPKSEPTGFAEDSTTKQPKAEIKEIAKPTGPADPFDPAIFNRQMHPEKK